MFSSLGLKGLVRFKDREISLVRGIIRGDKEQGPGGGPQRNQALVEIRVCVQWEAKRGGLTFVVLLFSLDRFGGELVVLNFQLMAFDAFDAFLDRALLEDGEEEVALVSKYACPLSLLSIWWLWSQYSYS